MGSLPARPTTPPSPRKRSLTPPPPHTPHRHAPLSLLTLFAAVSLFSLSSLSLSHTLSLTGTCSGKLKEHEVKRAIQLRDIVTSLGPAYIKLGQALSIRPDILSPAAMNELQKLCDKVPSFDSTVAMQVGASVCECVCDVLWVLGWCEGV